MLTRRGFLSGVLAAFVVRKLPKVAPPSFASADLSDLSEALKSGYAVDVGELRLESLESTMRILTFDSNIKLWRDIPKLPSGDA